MHRRSGKLIRVLAMAAAAAMLVTAFPASVATTAKGDVACRVYNLDKGISRNTLQRAVWAASPGDYLIVMGTCAGTTLVGKDLDIGMVEASTMPLPKGKISSSGKPRIRSGSWRPALVIDPGVDDFEVRSGLRILGGIIIDDLRKWRGDAKPVPATWKTSSATPSAPAWNARLRSCYVRNDETGRKFARSRVAVGAASAGDRLSLRGTCTGATVIDKDLRMTGWRVDISSTRLGSGKVSRASSGPPTLTGVTVDDDVDSLMLKRIRVTSGFSIRDL